MGVTISTRVHPGGLKIWWGAPLCQEARKSDWGAGIKPFVLLGCSCTALLLYCCTAVLLCCFTAVLLYCCAAGHCWGTAGLTFQNFSGVALTVSGDVEFSENAMKFHWGHPRGTLVHPCRGSGTGYCSLDVENGDILQLHF